MKTIIDPGSELFFTPLHPQIVNELESREGNKDFVYNLTPFVRVSCLQKVIYTDKNLNKAGNLRDIPNSVLVDFTTYDGFVFRFDSDFQESYGEIQTIGKTLNGTSVRIKNPRRVPPPSLDQFTATVGQDSDYFTTAQLTFTVNSLEQLQFLTPFLFNPHNSVFIEFGHNNEAIRNNNIQLFDSADADDLIEGTVVVDRDCNTTTNINGDNTGGFIQRMNNRIFDTGGAYDFFYGVINDFNFSMNENLGFDCTVDLISATQAKLKSNTDDYNTQQRDDRSVAITLKSKLKTFESFLQKLSDDTDVPQRIISFGDGDTTTYVRFLDILFFLDGGFNINDANILSAQEFVNSINPLTNNVLNDSNEFSSSDLLRRGNNNEKKAIDTILSIGPINRVKKARTDIGEPPVVSYSSDVLLFRKRMWNPVIQYNEETGVYSIRKIEAEQNIEQEDFKIAEYYIDQTAVAVKRDDVNLTRFPLNIGPSFSGAGAVEQQGLFIQPKYKLIRPFLVDIAGDDEHENLNNIYINFDKFKNIYLASEGKNLDILKRLRDIIDNATNELWDLEFIGEAIKPQNNETGECEKPISAVSSLSSHKVKKGKTYTFKANSKQSIFNEFSFELGLEGLLGDQIYMNSINSTDGSMDSQKSNLLLFTYHEDNLKIKDKRTTRIQAIREQQAKGDKGGGSADKNDTINKISSPDLKTEFFGRVAVGSPKRGTDTRTITNTNTTGVFPNSTPAQATASILINSVTDKTFYQSSIDDIGTLVIPDSNIDEDVRKLSTEEIQSGLLAIYDAERIPLIFTPVKKAIENLRAETNANISKEGEPKTNNGSESRGINPLLEAETTITMPGVGGINPLDYVKVSGIPDVYAKRGQFCVMNVAHTITPMNWETELTTRFRPTYDES